MADFNWIPPQLVYPPLGKDARPVDGNRSIVGTGGGAGAPVVTFDIDNFTIDEATTSGSLVGNFTATPSDTLLSLVNNPGGYFALDGNSLVTSDIPTSFADAPVVDITVRGTWAGKVTDKIFEIDVNPYAPVSWDLNPTTILHTASNGTVVGAFMSFPTPPDGYAITYTIDTENSGLDFVISGNHLAKGTTTLAAGTYVIWVTASVNGTPVPATYSRVNIDVT